jgi:hypothetical protein
MRVLTISDTHEPFSHPDCFDFLRDLSREIKPHVIVHLGDEIDAHGWSQWDRAPSAPGQADELAAACKRVKRLAKLFPCVKVCKSNHSMRAAKKLGRAGIPAAFLRSLGEVLGTPKTWHWADRWIVDGNLFMHGEGFTGMNAALTAARTLRRSCIIGHIHAWAGIQYHTNPDNRIFGMNAGCLIDPTAIAFDYGKHFANKPCLGTGYIIDGVPHWKPMS